MYSGNIIKFNYDLFMLKKKSFKDIPTTFVSMTNLEEINTNITAATTIMTKEGNKVYPFINTNQTFIEL